MSRQNPNLLVFAMDLGSSSTRTALFDETGRSLTGTEASRPYAVAYSADGGAELSPAQLRRAAVACLKETLGARLRSARLRKIPIAAVTGCGFWHSLLALDANSQPISPIFTWADSRCTPDAQQLRTEFSERKVHARTGCMLRSSFWPAKLCWLRRTKPDLFRHAISWVSPAQWIFGELFGVDAVSHSMASATGLYDLNERSWDEALTGDRVSLAQLGQISDTMEISRKRPTELRGSMILTAIGDGAASNIGSGAESSGRIAINLGTSGAARMIQQSPGGKAKRTPLGLFRYVVDGTRTVLGGAISNAGNLHQWCLRELSGEHPLTATRTRSMRQAATRDQLIVLPFWVQERAPSWPEELRGSIVGFSQSTTAAEIGLATTTAAFYRLAQIVELIETVAVRADGLIVSGGAARSTATQQLLADCIGRDLEISRTREASLRGTAVLALEKLGCTPAALGQGRVVRHVPELASRHRERREKQIDLEKQLST